MAVDLWLWALIGYLSGSIPFGYIVAKLKGVDITRVGSGNIGAANVGRTLGIGYGILVALLDISKTFIPTYLAVVYGNEFTGFVTAMFALIGAVASIFLKFRGGKGFGAFTGGYLALAIATNAWGPIAVLVTLWITIVGFTQMTGLANVVTIITAIPLHAMPATRALLPYIVFGAMVILYTHWDNILLMLEGKLEEQRFSNKKRSITMRR